MKLINVKSLFTGIAAIVLLSSTTFAETAHANGYTLNKSDQLNDSQLQIQINEGSRPLYSGFKFSFGKGPKVRNKFFAKRQLSSNRISHDLGKKRSFRNRGANLYSGLSLGFISGKGIFDNSRRGFSNGHNRSFSHRNF